MIVLLKKRDRQRGRWDVTALNGGNYSHACTCVKATHIDLHTPHIHRVKQIRHVNTPLCDSQSLDFLANLSLTLLTRHTLMARGPGVQAYS